MSRFPLLVVAILLCSSLLLPSLACAGSTGYTTYNMWYEDPAMMSTVNYKRGTLLPAGTLVKNIRVFKKRYNPQQFISFNRASDNQSFRVYFRRKFHPGKSIEDYRNMMFSKRSFKEQTANMSAREINAIRRGVLVIGMSKAAVKIAYGVPPQHKTPTLDCNSWRYWTSRMVTKKICFNPQGLTVRCQQEDAL